MKKDTSAALAIAAPAAAVVKPASPVHQLSPVVASHLSPKNVVSPSKVSDSGIEATSTSSALSPKHSEQPQLPPGLSRPVATSAAGRAAAASQPKKQPAPVVMPGGAPAASASSHVQFGSFGIAKTATTETVKRLIISF